MRLIDTHHLGEPNVIGCWERDGVLIDPGPASSIDAVIEALGGERPRAIALTHIHLDHAGATGVLVRRWPELPVYVHERGARHLADPSKLLASAGRLYGDQMERLWGEVAPVPQTNIHPLAGGETFEGMRVAYTPGHASHHVSYFDEATGYAFVGDVAAVRIAPSDFILPPTPPPDINLELWRSSIQTVMAWQPQSLGLTHFGAVDDPPPHMERVLERLDEQAERAKIMDADQFAAALRADAEREADPVAAHALLHAVPPVQQWHGLDRYWRKRAGAESCSAD